MPDDESWRRIAPEDRARQFMPFAALRGYYELVDEATRRSEPRREVSEERSALLDERLSQVGKGSMVRVTCYDEGAYVQVEGMVSSVDATFRSITVVKRKIAFDDVWDIEILDV